MARLHDLFSEYTTARYQFVSGVASEPVRTSFYNRMELLLCENWDADAGLEAFIAEDFIAALRTKHASDTLFGELVEVSPWPED